MAEPPKVKNDKKPDAEFVNIYSKDYRVIAPDSYGIIETALKDRYEITFSQIRPYTPERTLLEKVSESGYKEIKKTENDGITRFERRFEVSIVITKGMANDIVEWFEKKKNVEGE